MIAEFAHGTYLQHSALFVEQVQMASQGLVTLADMLPFDFYVFIFMTSKTGAENAEIRN